MSAKLQLAGNRGRRGEALSGSHALAAGSARPCNDRRSNGPPLRSRQHMTYRRRRSPLRAALPLPLRLTPLGPRGACNENGRAATVERMASGLEGRLRDASPVSVLADVDLGVPARVVRSSKRDCRRQGHAHGYPVPGEFRRGTGRPRGPHAAAGAEGSCVCRDGDQRLRARHDAG